jgi:hypothetical protein
MAKEIISVIGDRASGKTMMAIAVANQWATRNPGIQPVGLFLEGDPGVMRLIYKELIGHGVEVVDTSRPPQSIIYAVEVHDGTLARGTTKLITLTQFKEPYRG